MIVSPLMTGVAGSSSSFTVCSSLSDRVSSTVGGFSSSICGGFDGEGGGDGLGGDGVGVVAAGC